MHPSKISPDFLISEKMDVSSMMAEVVRNPVSWCPEQLSPVLYPEYTQELPPSETGSFFFFFFGPKRAWLDLGRSFLVLKVIRRVTACLGHCGPFVTAPPTLSGIPGQTIHYIQSI